MASEQPTENQTSSTVESDEIQSLPGREFLAPRWCYLQTLRTQCYIFHTQLFRRIYFLDALIKAIDERMDICAKEGVDVPKPWSQVNSMQQLFLDIMGLLDIAQLILTLQLAPAYEHWHGLYTIASHIRGYCDRQDWQKTCPQYTEIVTWRNIALEVFDYGVKSIQYVGDLVERVEHLAQYEGLAIGVGSIWPASF